MKIFSRTDFMKLPEGTIFSSGAPYAFSELMIKGESWEVDFLESNLISTEYHSSEEWADQTYAMHEKGASYPINKDFGREGLFDDKMLYLVYEKEDLKYLIDKFNQALKIEL